MPTEDYISQFEITEPAVQSGLYLKTLNDEEILCLCLDDLLRYYLDRANITCDNFVKEVIETTIKYHSISEVRLKQFSCLKYELDKAMEKRKLTEYEQIEKDSILKQKYIEMDKIGRFIKRIGYHRVSEERYEEMRNETAEKAKFYSKR